MMIVKKLLRETAEYLTNTNIFRSLPRGGNVFNDIEVAIPKYQMKTIFDVGANIGQSALAYIKLFPSSNIYCFEPVSSTFYILQNNTKNNPQVHCFKLAFSSYIGLGEIAVQKCSSRSHLLDKSEIDSDKECSNVEQVNIITLGQFCQDERINRISYLKIDTEGNDLEVLKGAEQMLKQQAIDFIEVEAGMSPYNERHVPFCELKEYLEKYKYLMFGIYEQIAEWSKREPHLRRSNPVFISLRVSEKYKTPIKEAS